MENLIISGLRLDCQVLIKQEIAILFMIQIAKLGYKFKTMKVLNFRDLQHGWSLFWFKSQLFNNLFLGFNISKS